MAKKGGGNKGSFWDNPFGGMFDFNRDGKEDWGEQWIAFKIFEECTKEEKSNHDYSSDYMYHSAHDDDYDTIDTSWRDFCEDGSEFDLDPEDYATEEEYEEALDEAKEKVAWRATCEDGSDVFIDPEDYDTEDEYNEALEEARNAWRYTADDGSEYGLDPDDFESEDEYNEALEEAQVNGSVVTSTPAISLQFSVECPALDKLEKIKEENYPNKRRYNAAYTLANEFLCYSDKEVERRDKACCRFIIDNADNITAANYLSYEGGFLYAQAIKDNFQLPVSLPDEDEYREYELSDALCKIAKRNVALSFEVWEWALTTFLPYIQYADGSLTELTSSVIDDLYSFPEIYRTELARYMDKHPDFMKKVLDEKAEMPNDLDALIAAALQDGLMNMALAMFKIGLVQAGNDWKKINGLTDGTIFWCKNYDELESAEYFKLNMLPLVKAINIGMVQDEIDEWEKGLDEYISQVENDCEKYTYTRKNAWRKTVPDGSQYGLDPCYYDSEQEYMEALNEEKYGWREWYKDDDTLGLDLNRFETQEDYRKAYDALLNEKHQREREQERIQLQEQRERKRCIEAEKARMDNKIYTFCGVSFPHALHPYHYRTEDSTIKVGDEVIVPVGDKETTGTVVSVGQYMRVAAPYPVDKTKFIICKIKKED